MKKEYDFVVIGGGSAGYAAARTASDFTDSVAVVDGAEELSGLCILRGCMPSKTLIYAAEVLHLANHGSQFGLSIPDAHADMAPMQERKKRIIREFADYRSEQLSTGQFDLHRSFARFTRPNTVALADGRTIRSRKFLIATGSVANVPGIPGLKAAKAWTSDEVLDLESLPGSVIVLGGGVVACELAQFLRRIGSKVVQVQRSTRILKEASSEASEIVAQAFVDEGIELFADTRLSQVSREVGHYQVLFEHNGKLVTKEAEQLLNALGRVPNTAQLGLENAGIEVRPSGHIKADRWCRSTNPDVYAAGDCVGPHEIVHVAILQGELAARQAFGETPAGIEYDHLLKVIFTDPQVASVGIDEATLEERDIASASASFPFYDHGKSILMEAKRGYVKVVAERKSGTVVGAECVGKDAGELIHALSVAVSLKATVFDLIKTQWYHPTLSEIWTYPLEDIAEELQASQ